MRLMHGNTNLLIGLHSLKGEYICIWIFFSLYQSCNYFCGYKTERNAIAAKAKRKIAVGFFLIGADKWQAISSRSKSTSPS